MAIRLLILSLLAVSLSHAKRPHIASYMKADQKITSSSLSTLDQISEGEVSLKYISSLVYGDGGSSGITFHLSDSNFLTVFVPFWSARYPKDIRLSVGNSESTLGWSSTLEEHPSLEALLKKMIQKALSTSKDEATKDQLLGLQKAIDRTPDETIDYQRT